MSGKLLAFYLGLMFMGLTGAVGDVWLYRWGRYRESLSLLIGMSSWIVCLITFGLLVRYGDRSLSATFILGTIVHILFVVGWDYVRENSRLGWIETSGIALAVFGIFLLECGRATESGPEPWKLHGDHKRSQARDINKS